MRTPSAGAGTDAIGAPTFPDIYPALRSALHKRRHVVVYEEQDERHLSACCKAHGLADGVRTMDANKTGYDPIGQDLDLGCHELRDEYAYYYGQLNAERDACIVQSLEAACRQQDVPIQPGLVRQCRMILGVVQSMSNWLEANALPEEARSGPDSDDEADFDDGSTFVDGTFSKPRKLLH